MFLHRYHDLQHKDAVFAFDGALPVVFVHGGADVGQAEAVEQGVFLGCLAAGVSVRQGVVFHRDDEHVVDAAGFYGDDAPGNGEFFAGFDGVIEGVAEEDIRAVISHGYGLVSDVEPQSTMEKMLFTVDELTGIIMATALMRPTGITDLTVKSVNKKFKDKRFAAKCNRDVIRQGCEMLAMDLSEVMNICIHGMQQYAQPLELMGSGS